MTWDGGRGGNFEHHMKLKSFGRQLLDMTPQHENKRIKYRLYSHNSIRIWITIYVSY